MGSPETYPTIPPMSLNTGESSPKTGIINNIVNSIILNRVLSFTSGHHTHNNP
jgi:hypothetical protein